MRKLLASGIFAALLASGAAHAATDNTVGTVDLQRAVTECKEGEAARGELLKRTDAVNAELKGMLSEVEKIRTEMAKDADKFSADERAERTRLLQKKGREFQNRQREAQEELKQVESERVKKLLAKFGPILNSIGEKEKLSVILDRNNGVYYAGKKTDVTPLLVQRADEEFEKR